MPSSVSRSDETFMREALRQARQANVPPYPNPWVGCVVVVGGRMVGRGFHRGPWTDHAEVAALAEAGGRARNATLFVNLEPCCHYGRTPPCTDAILKAGIRRVVYALDDPNPRVAGNGASVLKRHGIEVRAGVCVREARELNEVYLKFRATALPFATAKVAASLDGKIATRTGQSRWITDGAARRCGRRIRAQHQAVVVGINTVLADDPHLGPRIRGTYEPWRVVLDSNLRIPTGARVLNTGRCIVACAHTASLRKQEKLQRAGARVWRFRGRRVPLEKLLRRLAAEGIISVMVEGGSEVLGSFFDGGLLDRLYWFMAPVVLGSERSRCAIGGHGAATLPRAWRLKDLSIHSVGRCWLIRGNLSRWALG